MSVLQARDAYLAENGFTLESYDDAWTPVVLLGLRLGVPNTRHHRWAIMLHDLHHVATGFGTDLRGEAEVSAWELRRGLRGLGLYVGAIVTSGAVLGGLYAPRHVARAWRASSRGTSLFGRSEPYDAWLAMTVGELRDTLRIPRGGLAASPRGLHEGAPRPGNAPGS